MLDIEMDGFDDAMRRLKRLEENARGLTGTHSIPVNELCDPDFMRRHTKAATFAALIEASGHRVESAADFAAPAWDAAVRAHTSFASWDEMRQAAVREYTEHRLRVGL